MSNSGIKKNNILSPKVQAEVKEICVNGLHAKTKFTSLKSKNKWSPSGGGGVFVFVLKKTLAKLSHLLQRSQQTVQTYFFLWVAQMKLIISSACKIALIPVNI